MIPRGQPLRYTLTDIGAALLPRPRYELTARGRSMLEEDDDAPGVIGAARRAQDRDAEQGGAFGAAGSR